MRSFSDTDGDGVGDLLGITARLPYLADLGIDAVWLTPFYLSPQVDHGYDVADYRQVDPLFGTLEDFDAMLAAAHDLGIKVIIDIVPNHSSSAHEWFDAALTAGRGSPERARYVFRDGRGEGGDEPPNNWRSVFGGAAWTRVEDGQWYLHLFEESQPDFDWDNPEVGDEFESILRFWLDRGVDGFRIDVAHGMFKAEGLPDVEGLDAGGGTLDVVMADWNRPYWDQPRLHEVYRRWHEVLAEYDGDKMAIGEAWVGSAAAMARYVRSDELQQVFNFHWLDAPWSAQAFADVIGETFAAVGPVGASPTWVLSNHDVTRPVTRYGGGELGLGRSRAAMLAMLALPGSAYIYAGEELGLPQVDVPADARQDPTWLRGGGVGRDGCRVPMPWSGHLPPFGFGPDGTHPWLPQPEGFASLTVEAQSADPASTLAFFRAALTRRRELLSTLSQDLEMLDRGPGVLAFRRRGVSDGAGLACVLNCGETDHRVSDLGAPLMLSGPPIDAAGKLRPSAAAWFGA